jgi:hypothetical protein
LSAGIDIGSGMTDRKGEDVRSVRRFNSFLPASQSISDAAVDRRPSPEVNSADDAVAVPAVIWSKM